MDRLLVAGVVVLLASAACKPDPGVALIKRMRQQHSSPTPSLILTKDATFSDGRQQRWYDAVRPPGLRRLDIAPLDSLNGLLFRADSLYEISRGAVANIRPYVHALSLLSYDVYAARPAETAARLTNLGFDLKLVRVTTWQDRPTYVVGAPDGDRTANQFWIDRDRLCLVRLIERRTTADEGPGKPPLVQEVWLEGHRNVEGRWIPTEVSYFHNGRRFLQEKVEVYHASAVLDSSAFAPQPWQQPHWLPRVD